jgi:uncharacterized membrane protein
MYNLMLGIAIITLCFIDAVNTQVIIRAGGTELNPFMNLFINDITMFFLVKMGLTIAGVIILIKTNKTWILEIFFLGYLVLVVYELYLMWSIRN